MELLNKGVLCLNPEVAGMPSTSQPRTLIVSGVARSGTSMVARVLHAAGIFMGDSMDEVVFEDGAFALLLEHGNFDASAVSALLRERNAAYPVWGFKRPQLHQYGAGPIKMFRNPKIILTLRDPLAIAERNAIAEQVDTVRGLSEAMNDLRDLVSFAQELRCPTMLVSYEKAVSQPEHFIDCLLQFCGISLSAGGYQALLPLVEPNRPAYIDQARRVFEGYVDSIDRGVLTGWAWQKGLMLPVPITLLRDGVKVSDHMADHRRQDLVNSAIGTGHHGFAIDLTGQGFTQESRVGVIIGGRNFALTNSGSTVGELGGAGF